MHSPDDVEYAFSNTQVILSPDHRIDTFGDTKFRYVLLTEPMDSVNQTKIRTGHVEAERPRLIRPDSYADFDIEGFSEDAAPFFNWLKQQKHLLPALLKYGFQFRRSPASEEILHEPIESVCSRLNDQFYRDGTSDLALIRGIDDAWEVCLLRFTMEMIQKSQSINVFDLKRKGLI